MVCVLCVAAEAFCREYTSGADPRCLIQPHVAALFPTKMLSAEKLPGWLVWRWRVLLDLPLTPSCCFSYKIQGQGIQLSLRGALQEQRAPCYHCRGQANLTGKSSGEFIYLFLFYCLHKTAWKLQELIISLLILFFSFSTWLDLAPIAHLFIGFQMMYNSELLPW